MTTECYICIDFYQSSRFHLLYCTRCRICIKSKTVYVNYCKNCRIPLGCDYGARTDLCMIQIHHGKVR